MTVRASGAPKDLLSAADFSRVYAAAMFWKRVGLAIGDRRPYSFRAHDHAGWSRVHQGNMNSHAHEFELW